MSEDKERNDIRLYMMDYPGYNPEPEDLLQNLDMEKFLNTIDGLEYGSKVRIVGDLLASAYHYRGDYPEKYNDVVKTLFSKGYGSCVTWASETNAPMLCLVFEEEDWKTFDCLMKKKCIPYDCGMDRFILELVHARKYKQLMKLLQYYEQCLQK